MPAKTALCSSWTSHRTVFLVSPPPPNLDQLLRSASQHSDSSGFAEDSSADCSLPNQLQVSFVTGANQMPAGSEQESSPRVAS